MLFTIVCNFVCNCFDALTRGCLTYGEVMPKISNAAFIPTGLPSSNMALEKGKRVS